MSSPNRKLRRLKRRRDVSRREHARKAASRSAAASMGSALGNIGQSILRERDDRVVYAVGCSWWDSIDKVGRGPNGLPVCPHCGSVLMECPTEAEWWAGASRYESAGVASFLPCERYVEYLEWARGKCRRSTPDDRALGPRTLYDEWVAERDG